MEPLEFECECGKSFWISYFNFRRKKIKLCNECTLVARGKKQRLSEQAIIGAVADLKSGEYSLLTPYQTMNGTVRMRHNVCGNEWDCNMGNFYYGGKRCPVCAGNMAITHKEFSRKVEELCGDEYTVESQYINANSCVVLRHKTCGQEYVVRANHFIFSNSRCPCAGTQYRGEVALRELMQSLQLPFKQQFTFPDCIGSKGGVCRFDCAVLDSSDQSPLLLIEYDGKQHFEPVEFFGGQQEFEYRKRNDRIKDSYCKDHGIPLLRISYKQFDQIEQLVTDKLYELNILQKEAA